MAALTVISSEAWQGDSDFTDCRAEWLTDVLVERATRSDTAPESFLSIAESELRIGAASFVWMRFWFRKDNFLVEKYFNPDLRSIGMFVPICMPLQQSGEILHTESLVLGLWIDPSDRVTVVGEDDFDRAVGVGDISPVEAEQAEIRIRQMTLSITRGTFPPALVRNFAISAG